MPVPDRLMSIAADTPGPQLFKEGVTGNPLLSAQTICEVVSAAQMLYDGSLADLAEDVRRRQSGQPYLFVTDLAEPGQVLSIIDCLQTFERESGVVLAQVLQEESQ